MRFRAIHVTEVLRRLTQHTNNQDTFWWHNSFSLFALLSVFCYKGKQFQISCC